MLVATTLLQRAQCNGSTRQLGTTHNTERSRACFHHMHLQGTVHRSEFLAKGYLGSVRTEMAAESGLWVLTCCSGRGGMCPSGLTSLTAKLLTAGLAPPNHGNQGTFEQSGGDVPASLSAGLSLFCQLVLSGTFRKSLLPAHPACPNQGHWPPVSASLCSELHAMADSSKTRQLDSQPNCCTEQALSSASCPAACRQTRLHSATVIPDGGHASLSVGGFCRSGEWVNACLGSTK